MKKIDKRIFLTIAITIVFCASFQSVLAGRSIENNIKNQKIIDSNSAFLVACAHLKHLKKTTYSITNSNEIIDYNGKILCYVFNLNPDGYIVVTLYKTLPPVLAYSFTSSFSKSGTILFDLIRKDTIKRLTYLSEIPELIIEENKAMWNLYLEFDPLITDSTILQWPEKGATISGGWLETEWHQNSPFNNFCPMDLENSKRSVAGCSAVAMAQILNYHQTTNNILFNDGDDYHHSWNNNYWIDDDYETYDFPSYPQLNTYLETLILRYQNQETLTDKDKAALTFACGVAAKQVYSSTISGTFGVDQAYDAYKRFSFYDCELLTDDDPDVYDRVKDNIKNGLPVHLAVVNEDWTAGHNLVIDGYNDDGFYHLNFGWGGKSDGWYKLPEELPYELTVLEGVIVDIINENSYSGLQSEGVLYWQDTPPGATVEGSFTIENVGETGSNIDWEIIVWPDWGEWFFDSSSGTGLTPEDGPLTINVSVNAPDNKNKHFNGYVKVVDIDNNINSCLIHVSLTTPRSRYFFSIFDYLFQRNPNSFPLIRFLFNL